MYKMRYTLNLLVIFALCLLCGSTARAQACRTWVSGVGDDLNPCSRTAPCKTFAGAISKTTEGGEISVLDPGGYGAVTITKSITIDGGTGSGWASILGSGTNGIIVNVTANPSTAVVILRNITINGTRHGTSCGAGLNGIRYLAGNKLIVEKCTIYGFSQKGIDVNLANTGTLVVKDTTIDDNNDGIVMTNTAGTMKADISNVKMHANLNSGLNLLSGSASISNSVISATNNVGVIAQGGAAINVANCVVAHNNIGLQTSGASAALRISETHVLSNATGLSNGGTTTSPGDNKFLGNTADASGNAITSCPTCVK
jgi:hypothetical protein